ncbi:MAG: hypothetical protein WAU91_02090 [Desulfatitalea sp.]
MGFQPGVDPISHADPIDKPSYLRLQTGVFALVSAAFVNIYITQPVLPVLQREFAVDMVAVVLIGGLLLIIPIMAGIAERKGATG